MSRAIRSVLLSAVASALIAGLLFGGSTSTLRAQADPSVVGAWSAMQPWPIVSVHTALLPTGKVLSYPYSDDPRIWDPATASITAATAVTYNPFCSGLTLLADGRLFVGGGHISNNVGLNDASIYDAVTNTWSRQPDMNAGRWYPTTTTLADGSVLIVSGDIDTTVGVNRLPQVWSGGTWRNLTTAQIALPLYPFMMLAPDGRVFNAGPQRTARFLNTGGTGTWTNSATAVNPTSRGYGTAVMYEPGKVLLVGGADPPVATAEKIDLNLASPAWQPAGVMSTARRQLNATILPDGAVLVTGGSNAAGFNNPAGAVFTAERWNPADDSFTVMASATRYRGYHSTALLLPDGRVLSSGGDNEPNAEVFSPPYLFKGARPTVSSAPGNITYGQPFVVQTPDAAAIIAVTLVRLSTVTHAFNMNQRFLRLGFSAGANQLTVTPPSAGEIAPPGHYMLFLLNAGGVPSMAPIVRLSNDVAPSPPAAPSNLNANAISSSQIDLSWTDNAANESGFRIERSSDGTIFTEIGTVAANVTTFASTGLSAATQYWYRVRAYNGAGMSAYAGPANATTLAAAPSEPPSAPTGLAATRQPGQIMLQWTDTSSNETGFRILRSGTSATSDFVEIGTVGANATSYVDGSPGSSKFVYYRVRAYNAAGDSGNSNTLKVRNR
jgi:hypothetical protein